MTKPELGTARLFLWFDPAGCPAGTPTAAHPGTVPLSPAGWASQGHGPSLFWGEEEQGMLGVSVWERH